MVNGCVQLGLAALAAKPHRRHSRHDSVDGGLQQRLLGLLPRLGVTSRTTIPDLTLDRTPTLWEAMEEREEPRQQAFAAEEVPSTSIPLSDWIRRSD